MLHPCGGYIVATISRWQFRVEGHVHVEAANDRGSQSVIQRGKTLTKCSSHLFSEGDAASLDHLRPLAASLALQRHARLRRCLLKSLPGSCQAEPVGEGGAADEGSEQGLRGYVRATQGRCKVLCESPTQQQLQHRCVGMRCDQRLSVDDRR